MINFYGITFALAFLVLFIILRKFFEYKNINKDLAYIAIIYSIIGTLIGARLMIIIYYTPKYFIQNPINIFYIWQGGLSFHGGLIGASIALFIFCKKYKLNLLEVTDTLIIPVILFLGIGKIANFMNTELYGTITNLPWCVNFKDINGCRHPVQIYEAIKNFALFIFLIYLKTKKPKRGIITLSAIFLYTLLRFFIDFFREYNTNYLGLGIGQYLNIITFLISGYYLFKLYKKH
jgi:phosphatidylglycerol---prolipoprotein diacylglyceryl transferase